jgi:MYXO-CTERM domain-containing protein
MGFGTPGDTEPRTAWQDGGTAAIEREDAARLAEHGELAVFLADSSGNQTIAFVQPFHGQPSSAGCACAASHNGPPLDAAFVLVVLGFALRRRRDPR